MRTTIKDLINASTAKFSVGEETLLNFKIWLDQQLDGKLSWFTKRVLRKVQIELDNIEFETINEISKRHEDNEQLQVIAQKAAEIVLNELKKKES